MAKSALGRGLGELMGETQVPGPMESAPAPAASEPKSVRVAPGVETLLKAGPAFSNPGSAAQGAPTPPADSPFAARPVPKPEPAAEPEWRVPRWMLVTADVFLVLLAALVVLKSPVRLQFWEMSVCVGAIILGALLAVAALLMDRPRP